MGCFGFLKILMFLFNGIIFLAGAAILGLGIWVEVDSSSVLDLLGQMDGAPQELSQLLNVGYLMIAVGALLLLIGFLGCCGAARENRCLLLLFFIIILLLFIVEVAGAVVILLFQPVADQLFERIGSAAVDSIKKEYGENSDVTALWNSTMNTLRCCGFYNFSDFMGSPFYHDNNMRFPPQCCPTSDSPCYHTAVDNETPIIGCFPKIQQLISDNIVVIAAVALAVATLEICAMVVSMILYCRIRSRRA